MIKLSFVLILVPSICFGLSQSFTITDYSGVNRVADPATFGIPIAESANITNISQLGITASNGTTNVPAQFTVLSCWGNTVASGAAACTSSSKIKWVLVDIQATVNANTTITYYIKDNNTGNATGTLTLTQDANKITIDAGSGGSKWELNKTKGNIFNYVWAGADRDQLVVSQNNDGGFEIIDQNGTTFYSKSIVPETITVENDGPLHKVVNIRGVMATSTPTYYSPSVPAYGVGATTPVATLTPSATTGANIQFTASASVFDAGDVGREIMASAAYGVTAHYARVLITVVDNDTTIHGIITQDWASTGAVPSQSWWITRDFKQASYANSYCYYNARLHFYNGKDYVRALFTLENNGANSIGTDIWAPNQMLWFSKFSYRLKPYSLSDLTVTMSQGNGSATIGDGETWRFFQGWAEKGEGYESYYNSLNATSFGTLKHEYTAGPYYTVKEDATTLYSGTTDTGWTDINDGTKGIGLGVRWWWQNFFKAYTVTKTGVDIELYATGGYWPWTKKTDFPAFSAYNDSYTGGWDGQRYSIDGGRHKTHEVLMRFYLGAPGSTETSRQSAHLNDPLFGFAGGAYNVATGALGQTVAPDPTSADTLLNEAMQKYEQQKRAMVDVAYSDSIYTSRNVRTLAAPWTAGQAQDRHFGTQLFGVLKWGETPTLHYDWAEIYLRNFMRLGQKESFNAGSEAAFNRFDARQYHGTRENSGNAQITRSFLEWYEDDGYGSANLNMNLTAPGLRTHTWIGGLTLYYLLTGDQKAYETAQEYKTMANWWYGAGAPYDATTQRCSPGGDEIRFEGWTLVGLINLWRAFGDSADLTLATNIAKNILMYQEATVSNAGIWGVGETQQEKWFVSTPTTGQQFGWTVTAVETYNSGTQIKVTTAPYVGADRTWTSQYPNIIAGDWAHLLSSPYYGGYEVDEVLSPGVYVLNTAYISTTASGYIGWWTGTTHNATCNVDSAAQGNTMYAYITEGILMTTYESQDAALKALVIRMAGFLYDHGVQGGSIVGGDYVPYYFNYAWFSTDPTGNRRGWGMGNESSKDSFWADILAYAYYLGGSANYKTLAEKLFEDNYFYYIYGIGPAAGSDGSWTYTTKTNRSSIGYNAGDQFPGSQTKPMSYMSRAGQVFLWVEANYGSPSTRAFSTGSFNGGGQ